MPLPFPEVFCGKSVNQRSGLALKKEVVAIVMVLNFLFLQRPTSIGDALEGRRRLNRNQWEAVKRMEKFVLAWTEVSLITPELI